MQINIIGSIDKSTIYVNALTETSVFAHSLYVLAYNRRTGEEQLLDCVLPDDRLATVLTVIREVLGNHWSLTDSWEIEPTTLAEDRTAA